jgi:hypothetical protein
MLDPLPEPELEFCVDMSALRWTDGRTGNAPVAGHIYSLL